MLGPHYAVNRFTRCVTNSATGISLLRSFGRTLIALAQAFLNKFYLTLVACSARFDQWYICR